MAYFKVICLSAWIFSPAWIIFLDAYCTGASVWEGICDMEGRSGVIGSVENHS